MVIHAMDTPPRVLGQFRPSFEGPPSPVFRGLMSDFAEYFRAVEPLQGIGSGITISTSASVMRSHSSQ